MRILNASYKVNKYLNIIIMSYDLKYEDNNKLFCTGIGKLQIILYFIFGSFIYKRKLCFTLIGNQK